jgi:transmembrane sensor
MKRYFSKDISLESLIKFIDGSIVDAEKQHVDEWLNANPQNWFFFQKLKQAWFLPDDIFVLQKENIEKDWNNILMQMHKNEDDQTQKSRMKLSSAYFGVWIRVAAVILIIVSLLGAYFIGRSNNQSQAQLPTISYNEIIVPKGQRSLVTLSDGSKIWINAGSKFRFSNQFDSKIREVWLEGEAFFKVAKDKSKPFYVHTSDLNLKVHGTSFNVKAYAEEDIIETTLVEGSVSFEILKATKEQSKEVFLIPNHKAIYLKKETTVVNEEIKREINKPLEPRKIIISKAIKVEPIISWTEGKLEFADETFDNIAVKLERKYDVKIYIDNEDIKKICYTGVLKNVSIEQALKAIQLSMPINYSIKDNIVRISKN